MGCIHLYCGDGKGKTTAAMGLVLRFAGAGRRVLVAQFLKDGTSSELKALAQLPEVVILSGKAVPGFARHFSVQDRAIVRTEHDQRLTQISCLLNEETWHLLVLDEIIGALNQGLIDKAKLLDLLDQRPKGLEIALTGRNPDPELVMRADYFSNVQKIKHPYDRGLAAREGVEL
jgi:cob(I)alamin adenosyltransferase